MAGAPADVDVLLQFVAPLVEHDLKNRLWFRVVDGRLDDGGARRGRRQDIWKHSGYSGDFHYR
jgi:hypothetical protein